MAASPTQVESQIGVSIPKLGEDVLLLRRMKSEEEIGRLFEYELEMLSDDHGIKHQDVLGEKVTVRLRLRNDDTRFFNGHVSRFTYAGTSGEYARYVSTVRPWLWFLTLRSDCRIFQDMSVPEIIEDIFGRYSVSAYQSQLTAQYRKWPYCVQYRETDFDFVSRLMEHEGIYYHFEHEDGRHTLVMNDGDGVSGHHPRPGYEEVPYLAATHTDHVVEHVSEWSVSRQVEPGAVDLKDFDFRGPRNSLEAKVPTRPEFLADGVPRQSELEIYDYPGKYESAEEGEVYARLRMEEIEAQYEVAEGRTNARGLTVGGLFRLVDHPRTEGNGEFLIVSAACVLNSDAYGTSDPDADDATFRCRFRALAASRHYRLQRTTPRPMVVGPQTAIVVGPEGEKVWPDKFGRVKVQFHWDRYGQHDENSSCWIRVSQSWAGVNWGAMSIPHVGQEVVVEFLEGDPDRPLITGRVYNADHMPPLELPGNKHKSILRDDYGNQIVFDATPGEEHITLYSPHHDSGLEVGKSVFFKTDSDSGEIFAGAKTEVLGGAKTETVIGGSSEAFIGFNSEFKLASSMEAFWGSTVEYKAAVNYEISEVDSVKSVEHDWLQLVDGDAILDCKGEDGQKLILCAGTARDSVVEMGAEELVLKVGSGERSKETGKAIAEWIIRVATYAAALSHMTNAGSAVTRYALAAKDGTSDEEKDSLDAGNLLWSLGTHGVVTALHAVVIGALLALYRSQVRPDNVKEEIGNHRFSAKMEMKKEGSIAIRGAAVDVFSDQAVYIKANDIILNANGAVAAKGRFKHPNLEILA